MASDLKASKTAVPAENVELEEDLNQKMASAPNTQKTEVSMISDQVDDPKSSSGLDTKSSKSSCKTQSLSETPEKVTLENTPSTHAGWKKLQMTSPRSTPSGSCSSTPSKLFSPVTPAVQKLLAEAITVTNECLSTITSTVTGFQASLYTSQTNPTEGRRRIDGELSKLEMMNAKLHSLKRKLVSAQTVTLAQRKTMRTLEEQNTRLSEQLKNYVDSVFTYDPFEME